MSYLLQNIPSCPHVYCVGTDLFSFLRRQLTCTQSALKVAIKFSKQSPRLYDELVWFISLTCGQERKKPYPWSPPVRLKSG